MGLSRLLSELAGATQTVGPVTGTPTDGSGMPWPRDRTAGTAAQRPCGKNPQSASTCVRAHMCVDARTRAHVRTPTRTLGQSALLSSGFSSYKLGGFMQMSLSLCVSCSWGKGGGPEGSRGDPVPHQLVGDKGNGIADPLAWCLPGTVEGQVFIPGWCLLELPFSQACGSRRQAIHYLMESSLGGVCFMPIFQVSYLRLGEVSPCRVARRGARI